MASKEYEELADHPLVTGARCRRHDDDPVDQLVSAAVIGHRGEIIAQAPEYEANVMKATLQPRIGLTPHARSGNVPIVCLALVFSLFGVYYGRRGKPT